MTDATPFAGLDVPATTAPVEGNGGGAATDKDAKLAKKQKKGGDKKSGDKGGKRGAPKGDKKPKKRLSEPELLRGISKPAIRRIFKQISGANKMRLAEDSTASIRAIVAVVVKNVTTKMIENVVKAGRRTSYAADARDAVKSVLPRSTIYDTTKSH